MCIGFKIVCVLCFYLTFPLATYAKGRKADWRAVDSPKKRTDKSDLFAMNSKKVNKANSFVRFLGEFSRP